MHPAFGPGRSLLLGREDPYRAVDSSIVLESGEFRVGLAVTPVREAVSDLPTQCHALSPPARRRLPSGRFRPWTLRSRLVLLHLFGGLADDSPHDGCFGIEARSLSGS